MRSRKLYGLKRLKIRQSWSKYNLYNLARAEPQKTQTRTFFQQKWTAKAMSRAYHGENIQEKRWYHMFRSNIRSVVPMDYKYLAQHDGSEQAAGRGSGADSRERGEVTYRTPHLMMTYAPLERRLDTAIFRALFASSARQARQFVIHGYVKVNGQKMIYPGYQLNPGDMFQVEPERVMWATGASKERQERRIGRLIKAKTLKKKSEEKEEQEPPVKVPSEEPPQESPDQTKQQKVALKDLMQQAKEFLSSFSSSISAKRKHDLREFQRTVRKALARPNDSAIGELGGQLQGIIDRISISKDTSKPQDATNRPSDIPQLETPSLQSEVATLTPFELQTLRDALESAKENPSDPTKPYATPWRPREWMSAFAFIPRYLEVHPRICAAVYIRHPVARPGLAEVPTPFTGETLSLAHNWYLRHR
ncbi:uncharacterized protein KY384_008702 [Bacidia gigantensis]|uniref:uncharacterized protein n=1 Tax=Bacidia gigantensis TaxID=2732470 RepID=UPI001D059E0B|nr:uncharacterized protein KY384_008702 [Bacidia gigantensis]KAG8526502.1 hypothetical protein KY384_008702 [Bacidia gigantensis]